MIRPPLLTLIPAALGNNRTVINGTTGAVEQTVAYYPFGGVTELKDEASIAWGAFSENL